MGVACMLWVSAGVSRFVDYDCDYDNDNDSCRRMKRMNCLIAVGCGRLHWEKLQCGKPWQEAM